MDRSIIDMVASLPLVDPHPRIDESPPPLATPSLGSMSIEKSKSYVGIGFIFIYGDIRRSPIV